MWKGHELLHLGVQPRHNLNMLKTAPLQLASAWLEWDHALQQ